MNAGPISQSEWRSEWRWRTGNAAVLLLAQIAIGCALTWGTWPDVLIDFGREWYIPQRLAAGDVLYRDLAYFNGPFSPCLNAGLFTLFGSSLRTLIWANLALLALFVWGLYLLLSRISTSPAALLATSLVIWLCAFSQYLYVGNYNWVCPYSHEMTHGLVLSLGALLAAERYVQCKHAGWLATTGLLCGLIFLTKCEIAIAAYAGVGILLCGPWLGRRMKDRFHPLTLPPAHPLTPSAFILHLSSFVIPFALPIALAVLLLSRNMPLATACSCASGSWKYLLQRDLTGSEFYRSVMGTASVRDSLLLVYGWTVVYIAALSAGVWAGQGLENRAREWTRFWGVFLGLGAMFLVLRDRLNWLSMARPWPLVMALVAASLGWNLWKTRPGESGAATNLLRLAVTVWAGLLLLKIVFFCRVFHYGFALAAPALAVVTCAGWDWWPGWLQRRGYSPLVARSGVLAVIVAATVCHVALAARHVRMHTIAVGSGANRFLADERGEAIKHVLNELEKRVPPGATLACLPEGATLNALSGRRTSLRFINFVPADVLMFGERTMFDDLRTAPPDWIALINRDTSEYGPAAFTIDYATEFGKWIDAHYAVRVQHGGPFMTSVPGYSLLQRRRDNIHNLEAL